MLGVNYKPITDQVRESCRLVVENSKYVKVNTEAINRFISEFANQIKTWNQKLLNSDIHYTEHPLKAIWFFFVLDTINFCFWADKKTSKWTIKYNQEYVSGYNALALCLKRECSNSELFVYPYYWAKIFKNELMRMLYPTYEDLHYAYGELKLIEERVTNLRELGENIFQKPISEMYKMIFWEGIKERNVQGKVKEEQEDPYRLSLTNNNNPHKIVDILVQANRDVNKFVSMVVETFNGFNDVATYQLNDGKVIKVGFYKRAQILAHDLYLLYQHYKNNNPEILQKYQFLEYLNFKNISKLTAFADYKLPQYLSYKGIISYSEDLQNEINTGKIINPKDIKEVEIRSATVYAVELIAERTKTYPALVDNILWNLAKSTPDLPNHHRTVTIYY
ncbi:MAG: queuosine salvage family protein [bacterium]